MATSRETIDLQNPEANNNASDNGHRQPNIVPSSSDCPICLNKMKNSDIAYPLRCRPGTGNETGAGGASCGYNFCGDCIRHLVESSKCGYEEASDGSQQVKVKLVCPQCRSDLSMSTVDKVLRDRAAFEADKLKDFHDDELTAAELRLKYTFELEEDTDGSDLAHDQSGVTKHQLQPQSTEKRKTKPELFSELNQIVKSKPPELVVDETLFFGLAYAMTADEQKYVTELMTSGDVDRVAQAVTILSSISEMSKQGITPSMRCNGSNSNSGTGDTYASSRGRTYSSARGGSHGSTEASRRMRSGYSSSVAVGRALKMSRTAEERRQDKREQRIERHRKSHPLPPRMPRHVTLDAVGDPVSAPRRFPLSFEDDEWDGSVADAFSRVHVGWMNRGGKKKKETMSGLSVFGSQDSIDDDSDSGPRSRVLVAAVRGQGGRLGIQRGDVVTHFDGMRFEGNANDLACLIQEICLDDDVETFSLILNAEVATVEALRRRALYM